MNFLTKTDFVNAFTCPTKLNYLPYPNKFTDASIEDEYLQSLSDGGYQIGKLAQLQYKQGIETSIHNEEAITQTEEWLLQKDTVVFEAAIQHNNFFIRIDIIHKEDQTLNLIEVKAKSYDSSLFEEDNFYNQNGSIQAEWQEYFYDLAFQYYVTRIKYPHFKIKCFFNLPNKNISSQTDNLFNKFSIKNKKAYFLGTEEDLKDQLIYEVDVTDKIIEVVNSTYPFMEQEFHFSDIVNTLATAKVNQTAIPIYIGSHCKGCQFRDADIEKSGMYQCWKHINGFNLQKFNSEKIIDIWNVRSTHKLFQQRKYFIDDIEPEDINIDYEPTLSNKAFSNKDRQYFQCFGIESFANDENYILNSRFLQPEIDKWKYPLNFIDFETATLAIPPYKGLAPYELIAFQYSIHTMNEDGKITHSSQFLSAGSHEFPNLKFITQLSADLSTNDGSIFMWYPHEQRTIESIKQQIIKLGLVDKYKDEIAFIDSLLPLGNRELIDLYALAKNGSFYPNCKGSVSIKKVLPAVINHSQYIQNKYAKPIYGIGNKISSLNFEDIAWVQKDHTLCKNPYDIINANDDEAINQGGMAATTFAKLQFEDLSESKRVELKNALLKYCELDTFAMVIIAESWLHKMTF